MENLRTAAVGLVFSSSLFPLGKQENIYLVQSIFQLGARLCDVFARPVNRSSSSFWNLMACLDQNSAAARRCISISASSITVNFRARPFNGNPKRNHM